MNKLKKPLALLLCAAMTLGVMPALALAEEGTATPPAELEYNEVAISDEDVAIQQPADISADIPEDKLPAESPATEAAPAARPNMAATPAEEQDNQKETVTRIDWIHELASRFCTDLDDCADITFSDYGQSEEFYRDAAWAWEAGLFEENDGMYIRPFEAATREFTARTLTSCLDLGLGDGGDAALLSVDDAAPLEEEQIALNRGWFDGEDAPFDAAVDYAEVGVMLSDAEEIVSMQEVQEDYASTYEYSDGVIEVPQNIDFEISPDETAVTLYSDSVSIEAGDNFVVYLDSLPIAYTALSVARENGQTVIAVEKAEANVFSYVDAQGVIPLSAENSEFIPANDVELMDGLEYSNGKLSLSTSIGDSKAEIYLSDLHLNHSFSDNGFTVTVDGSWGLTSTQVYKDEAVSEVPLGQIRVFGIGVIAVKLSLSLGMEMSADVSGTFTAGASVLSDGTTRAIHEFSVGNCSVTGQGSITAALKVSAGVDILVAQAIVYGEIGFKTQYTSQIKKNSSNETVHCQDYKYYLFLSVGADLNYFAFWSGKMEKLTGKEIPLADEKKSPVIWQIHFENGQRVGSCSMGMTVADLDYGGTSVVTDGSLSFDGLDRRLETSVALPGDVTVPNDLTVDNGVTLDLNGHTLTVEGNLIIEDGNLSVGSGTLNVTGRLLLQKGYITMNGGTVTVNGDFRIQSATEDMDGEEVYGETDAYVCMENESILTVGGAFITQSRISTSSADAKNYCASDCTIYLKGGFSQLAGAENNFVCNAKVVFCGQTTQSIYFETPETSYFENPSFKDNEENIKFNSKIKGWKLTEDLMLHQDMDILGAFDLNGHTLTVDGDLVAENDSLYLSSGTLTVNGDLLTNYSIDVGNGTLTVNGDLNPGGGLNIENGTMYVTGNLPLQKGYIIIDGGMVTVDGDFRIQRVTKDADGKEVYGETNAYICMENESILTVGGAFITQSRISTSSADAKNYCASDCTIYLKGDFSQLAGAADNFVCDAKVVFCGQNIQDIYFETPESSYFENLSFKGNGENIIFNSKIEGWKLTEDLVFHQDMDILGTFDLNGHTLTVDGGMIVENLKLSNGVLTVNGDLINNNSIYAGNGAITVNGDLITNNGIDVENGTIAVDGDLIIKDGNSSIESGTLNVTESLLLQKGCICINGSMVTVDGDFRIQGITVDSEGKEVYGETNAYMQMENVSVLTVGRDFVTQSRIETNYYDTTNHFYDGCTIYLKGNFTQLAGAADNFVCDAKVVLCGQTTQNIYFATPNNSYFNNLSFKENGENIKINSKIKGWKLTEDLVLHQGMDILGAFDLNGHTLTVNGNLIVENGNLSFNGGALTVNGDLITNYSIDIGNGNLTVSGSLSPSGNLIIENGTLSVIGNLLLKKGYVYINGSMVTVDGDFRIQGITVDSEGKEVYGETNAYMKMENGSVLTVGGDFVTQSRIETNYYDTTNHFYDGCTIYLKGNFTQLAGAADNFVCDAKVVLCGTDKQTITFETYPSSRFTTLQLTHPMSNYVFNPNPCWDTLIEAEVETEVPAEMTEPVLQTNGSAGTVAAKLTCPQSLTGTNATPIAAFYDENGMMLAAWMGDELALQDGMDLEITGELPDGYSTVKLFLLDLPACAPICKAKHVPVGR